MQHVYANLTDNTRTLLFSVGLEYDVQRWANDRQKALRLLNVKSLSVELSLVKGE